MEPHYNQLLGQHNHPDPMLRKAQSGFLESPTGLDDEYLAKISKIIKQKLKALLQYSRSDSDSIIGKARDLPEPELQSSIKLEAQNVWARSSSSRK